MGKPSTHNIVSRMTEEGWKKKKTKNPKIVINDNNSGLLCANDQCVWMICIAAGQNALYMFQFDNMPIQYVI